MRQRVLIAMALACRPSLRHRGRTDDGARRDHSGADSRPAARDESGVQPVAAAHHPRPRRHRRDGRPRRGHVRGPHSSRKDRCAPSFASPAIRTRAGCWPRSPAAPPASGFAPSTATCRFWGVCRPAARSTPAARIASSRALPRRRRTILSGADHQAKCYLHDPDGSRQVGSRQSAVGSRSAVEAATRDATRRSVASGEAFRPRRRFPPEGHARRRGRRRELRHRGG